MKDSKLYSAIDFELRVNGHKIIPMVNHEFDSVSKLRKLRVLNIGIRRCEIMLEQDSCCIPKCIACSTCPISLALCVKASALNDSPWRVRKRMLAQNILNLLIETRDNLHEENND